MKLRKNGCSRCNIAKELGISIHTVENWIYGITKPRPYVYPHAVNLNPSKELSYVLGVYYGDGSAWKSNKGFFIELQVKDRDFIDEFNRCISWVLNRKKIYPTYVKRELFKITTCSKLLYEFLKKPLEEHKIIIKNFPAEFLRGFYDSEGCVVYRKQKWGKPRIDVDVCNTDLSLLNYIKDILACHFSIYPSKKVHIVKAKPMIVGGELRHFKKDVYHICISAQESVQKFYNQIGFSIKRKQEKLGRIHQILNTPYQCNYCNWRTNNSSALGGHTTTNHSPNFSRNEGGRFGL